MQQAFFPLNLTIQLYFRVNSGFMNKSLNVMQAVCCLVAQRQAVLLSPHSEKSRIPGGDYVLDQRLQSRHLDSSKN